MPNKQSVISNQFWSHGRGTSENINEKEEIELISRLCRTKYSIGIRFFRVVSSTGSLDVHFLNKILILVSARHRFCHRGKYTSSLMICQFD